MFCSKCGKEISDNSTFCQYCGEKIEGVQKESNSSEIITERQKIIMDKLKPYPKRVECTCTECGYKGLMGVIRTQPVDVGRKVIGAILGFGFSFFLFWHHQRLCGTLIVFLTLILMGIRKKVLYCPSCESELIEN